MIEMAAAAWVPDDSLVTEIDEQFASAIDNHQRRRTQLQYQRC